MADVTQTPLTGTEGHGGLPRYFARVFAVVKGLNRGRLDFVLPDGRRFRAEGGPGAKAEIHIHDPDLFARLIREGDLGFCEAYLDEGWSTPDLMAFMELVHAGNDALYDGFPGMAVVRAAEQFRHWLRGNTRTQARRNIAAHYDLGNDFYALWLDPSMTYSAALFTLKGETLAEAQRAKYAAIVDALAVRPGDHVLEIGCGWGGFAEYAAAERGLLVTGLTLSRAQYDYALARISAAGLSDRVSIRLQDYRDFSGQFDAVASIEMFEAVGEAWWPTYFAVLADALKPGARACIQAITVQERRFNIYRKAPDFIQKYIFPGGMLPAPSVMQELPQLAGLQPLGGRSFGDGYAHTLRIWADQFNARWDEIRALGFDERFRRMWNFYLASCAGAFHGQNCDVTQFIYSRPNT
ncbi:class I SAM-dependent methyltransferase [Phaeovulum sp.]|uniref:class I SAM-dependent methyltransferase n=1 Tax=Phaeovulum sp. TaxID=2934796 RepID=UPI0039E33D26